MYFNTAIALLVIGLAAFIAYIVYLAYCNSLMEKLDRNHFRNSFPYNYYADAGMFQRVVLYVLLAIFILCISVGEAFYFISLESSFSILIGIFLPLGMIALGISNVIPLSGYRSHLIASAIGFLLLSASSLLFSFASIIPSAINPKYNVSVPIQVFFGIIGAVLLLALINPKLADWSKMDKTEKDGTTYYVKPKVNFYAMYEWIYLFAGAAIGLLCMLNAIFGNNI